jgi:hypothetical protein
MTTFARELLHQTVGINVSRNQEDVMLGGIFQDPPIASPREPIQKSAFQLREQVILWEHQPLPPTQRRTRTRP